METRKQLMMTGLFLLMGISVVLLTVLMLGGTNKIFQKSAHIYVKFDQVQGLNQGSMVSLSGLPIGNIDSFEFDPSTHKIKVALRVQQKELNKLTIGTQAEIKTQGALGDKYVYITPGEAGGEKLKDRAEIPAVKSTDMLAMLSEKASQAEKVFDIIDEIDVLMKTLNADNKIGKILNHLDSGSATFSKMAATAEGSMNKFDRVMTRIDRGEGTLGALISDPSIHDQLKNILGGSQRKSQVKDLLRKSVDK